MGEGCLKGLGCSKVQHAMRGIGIERFLHGAFDSDGDTDADTDACGEGSRPGSSWFLTRIGLARPSGTGWRSLRRRSEGFSMAMRTSPPRVIWGSGGLFGIGIGIGIGIERFLHGAFDSDGDTDADTDACGKGSRAGASLFFTLSGLPAPLERGGDVLVAVPKDSPWR
jgi:hypothetical protein